MRRLLLVAPAVLLCAATAFARHAAAPADREVARIRSHFDSVLVELDAGDHGGMLAAPQRARRASLVQALRAYRDRGVFPHNYDFPGRATPYFVDRRTGALCAVANLLAVTGRHDIVDRVARTDNNVWVESLARDTAFASWLDANGLTLVEAARIQMPYVISSATPAQQRRNVAFAVVSPIAAASSIVSSVLNLRSNADGHSRVTSIVGIVSGAATAGLGLITINKPGVPMAASVAGATLGGLGIALSTRSMHHRTLAMHEAERATVLSTASVAPFVSTHGDGAGLSVSLHF